MPGVLALIMAGDHPARCPDGEIERLRMRMNDRGLVVLPPPPQLAKRAFRKGEPVRIVAGPFANLSAVHSGMSTRDKEILLLSVLSRETKVAVDRALVAARSEAARLTVSEAQSSLSPARPRVSLDTQHQDAAQAAAGQLQIEAHSAIAGGGSSLRNAGKTAGAISQLGYEGWEWR
jgi:hypothetical protein